MAGDLGLIDTIAVLMMENRSFDHLLGFLSHESFDARKDVDGLHQHSATFNWDNADSAGRLYAPTATPDGYLPTDLPHSRDQVADQIRGGAMDGFIQSYFASQDIDKSPIPMRFCRPEDVPVTAALARAYTVCDRWFASLPVDTQPNRLMAMSGYTLIDSTGTIKPPFHNLPDQTTVFDWLLQKKKQFEIYVDSAFIPLVGVPSNLLLMKSQWPTVKAFAHPFGEFAKTWQSGDRAPDVLYFEPFYNDIATALGEHGDCNHPPLPLAYGEDFLKRVYTTLVSNPEKWKKTMLIICYDEHGGFFDHVAPPGMKYSAPPKNTWLKPDAFPTLGVRVPGIVVSPLAGVGKCFSGLLDHTSILQLMVDRFGTPNDLAFFHDAVPRKNNRVLSLAETITESAPRPDIPGVPDAPKAVGPGTTPAITDIGLMFRGVMADKPALVG
jgi:phospholipase C